MPTPHPKWRTIWSKMLIVQRLRMPDIKQHACEGALRPNRKLATISSSMWTCFSPFLVFPLIWREQQEHNALDLCTNSVIIPWGGGMTVEFGRGNRTCAAWPHPLPTWRSLCFCSAPCPRERDLPTLGRQAWRVPVLLPVMPGNL